MSSAVTRSSNLTASSQFHPLCQPMTPQTLPVRMTQQQANTAKRNTFVTKIQFARESKCRSSKTNYESTTAKTKPNLAVMAESIQPRKRRSSTLDCSAKQIRRMAILPSETNE